MKIHVLQCGCIRVDPTVPFGKKLDLIEAAKQLTAADKNRITLPVFTYLIEHPKGLILVDTGWCREISPRGVYDPRAAAAVLPAQMAALFHPFVSKGMAIHEQLADMGIQPEDLDYVLLTHLDVDHVDTNTIGPAAPCTRPGSRRISGSNTPWSARFTVVRRSARIIGSLICSETRASSWSMCPVIRKARRRL